ncbi:MAG: PIN domain-containing protein [Phototrophicaceae bacterium]
MIALLDANVLYPAPLRDVLLQLAVSDIFRARWTRDIHREWIGSLLRNEPHRDREKLQKTRDMMDQATRDALITGYEPLINTLELPDPNDRHILAAAITGYCDVIVTKNLKDFPDNILLEYNLKAQHPDRFLLHHLDNNPTQFCAAIAKVRARLKRPSYNVQQYLSILAKQELPTTVALLEQYSDRI